MEDPVITTREAAELLGVSIRTAQGWVENGALDSWKTPGGHRRVRRSAVLALLSRVRPAAPTESSALVVVLAAAVRLPCYRDVFGEVAECLVDTYSDTFAAMLAVGTMLPAVIVLELGEEHPERFSMLRFVATDSSLGHTCVMVLSDLPRAQVVELTGLDARLEVVTYARAAADLPARLRAMIAPHPRAGISPPGLPAYPVLLNESARAAAVERTGLVDTQPEEAFDRVTWLASQMLGMPIALVTLLTATRQWFKSRHGLDMVGTPRESAFCNYTVMQKDVFVVEDAALDPRFAGNPYVRGEPNLRFYAGAPLIGEDGFALGALCVIDRVPRALDSTQLKALAALAALAADEIVLRTKSRQLQWARAELHQRR
jgi:excisionase family DNA binding protein